MEKRYFHELSKEEYDKMMENHLKIIDVKKQFKQPDWCLYPDALEGEMGCWSLCLGDIHCEDDCECCDCHKENK